MINPVLYIPLLTSFFLVLFVMPFWIRKATQFNFVGKDINKFSEPKVSEGGGVIVVAAFMLGILLYVAIKTFYFKSNDNLIEIFALTTSLLVLAMIGLVDGSLGWKVGLKRKYRLALCIGAAIPLMVINAGQSSFVLPLIGEINSGWFYPLLLVPIGIVATSTTFNFLAGFNGLEAGQGILLLGASAVVAYFTGSSWLALILLCMVASLAAFLVYNFYPAKVFPGDVLTYPVGGMIAIAAILGNFEKIALFFFIPTILEVILKVRGSLIKQSFRKPNSDGSLSLKYNKIYSLNHLSIYLMEMLNIKPTEKKVVISIWIFQLLIIGIGFLIFRKFLF